MSRLIVKNLPKKISENQLKEQFSKHGNITDIQLKYKADGSFRQFAFVGYENEEEAQTALSYLNKSYIGASKVTVEVCKPLSDKDLSARTGVSLNKKEERASNLAKIEPKNDKQLEEFLALHKRSKSAVWMDDGVSNLKLEVNETGETKSDEESDVDSGDDDKKPDNTAFSTISDKEYLKSKSDKKSEVLEKAKKFPNLMTVKLTNLPCKVTKKDIKNFFKPLKCKSIRIPVKAGFAFVGLNSMKDVSNALNKHNSFLDGHQVKIKCVQKKDSDKSPKKYNQNPNNESLMDTGRIFIRNLSYKVNEDIIEKLFNKFGQLTEVNLPVDKLTRQCKGFGFVTYMFPEDAVKAFTKLDGSILQGRTLHLLPSEIKETGDLAEDEGKVSFKEKRLKELKGKSSTGYNWNSSFLGGNAVADVLSKNYNVSKEEIYDPHADGSAAVRIAIGETQIVNDIKNFLLENGVNLDAFKNNKVRSKKVILVKNLPAGTKISDITEKFGVFGPLQRVILHPSGLTGIVEFAEPSEARSAFSSLAYSRFKHLPLYLEWAPENVFVRSFDSQKESLDVCHTNSERITVIKEKQKDDSEDDDDAGNDGNCKLFVKNLNFATTDEDLINHFSQVGEVRTANVARKKDWNSGTLASMGYGFVTYRNSSDCERALKTLQHSLLDERMIEIKRSHSMAVQPDKGDRHKRNANSSTKLLVKNVAFQANKQELEELFRPFGDVKSIRLPKKLEGSHRGFCFVEYGSKKHAKKAISILGESTHLYGRRLVLEWAESEEDVNAIRKRTADNYNSGPEPVKKAKGVADIVNQNASDPE